MALFIYAVLYAFFGWILEVCFYIYKTKSFVNRGFLNGPFVPIYGVSLVTLHIILYTLIGSFVPLTFEIVFVVFLMITFIATLFELIGGMVLFNAFQARWWDYSQEKFNYKGYISLRFSMIWGVLGTLFFLGIHVQWIVPAVEGISETTLYVLSVSLAVVLAIDYAYTIKALFSFKSMLIEFKKRFRGFEARAAKLKDHLPKSVLKTLDSISENDTFIMVSKKYESLKSKLVDIKDKAITKDYNSIQTISKNISKTRLFKAFPELKIPFTHKSEENNDE